MLGFCHRHSDKVSPSTKAVPPGMARSTGLVIPLGYPGPHLAQKKKLVLTFQAQRSVPVGALLEGDRWLMGFLSYK